MEVSVELRDKDPDSAEHVVWALSTSFLFTTSKIDQAVGESREREVNRYLEEGPEVAILGKLVLLFAPLYVVVLTVVADVVSLALPSKLIGGDFLWSAMSNTERISVIVKLLVCTIVIVAIQNVLKRAIYFTEWTQSLYRGITLAVHRAKVLRNEADIPWADEQEVAAALDKAA